MDIISLRKRRKKYEKIAIKPHFCDYIMLLTNAVKTGRMYRRTLSANYYQYTGSTVMSVLPYNCPEFALSNELYFIAID